MQYLVYTGFINPGLPPSSPVPPSSTLNVDQCFSNFESKSFKGLVKTQIAAPTVNNAVGLVWT